MVDVLKPTLINFAAEEKHKLTEQTPTYFNRAFRAQLNQAKLRSASIKQPSHSSLLTASREEKIFSQGFGIPLTTESENRSTKRIIIIKKANKQQSARPYEHEPQQPFFGSNKQQIQANSCKLSELNGPLMKIPPPRS